VLLLPDRTEHSFENCLPGQKAVTSAIVDTQLRSFVIDMLRWRV